MLSLSSCGLLLAAGSEAWWSEQFFGLDQGQRFVLLIIGIGCATGIIITTVAIVGGMIETMHRRRVEGEMKRDMLDRGMSADEIARVVESAQPKDFLERWASAQGKGKKPS
jgi:hypothetical protein